MDNKEIRNYIDESINYLKEDLKEYIDNLIENDLKVDKKELNEFYEMLQKSNECFYEKFIKSDEYFYNNKALYNFDINKLKVGDIVFGIVYGDGIKDIRYPFKIIYKDNESIILEGTKYTGIEYTFDQACDLRWDVKLFIAGNSIIRKYCTIISKDLIDKYKLENLTHDNYILAMGFGYWTSTKYEGPTAYDWLSESYAWLVSPIGAINNFEKPRKYSALPHVMIYNNWIDND